MTTKTARLVLWGPRVLGILTALFLGLFALDSFSPGKPALMAIRDFIIHLIPTYLVLALVAISWRREWVGGAGFIGLALLYMAIARNHLDWILVISGPLLLVGFGFVWSWLRHDAIRSS